MTESSPSFMPSIASMSASLSFLRSMAKAEENLLLAWSSPLVSSVSERRWRPSPTTTLSEKNSWRSSTSFSSDRACPFLTPSLKTASPSLRSSLSSGRLTDSARRTEKDLSMVSYPSFLEAASSFRARLISSFSDRIAQKYSPLTITSRTTSGRSFSKSWSSKISLILSRIIWSRSELEEVLKSNPMDFLLKSSGEMIALTIVLIAIRIFGMISMIMS